MESVIQPRNNCGWDFNQSLNSGGPEYAKYAIVPAQISSLYGNMKIKQFSVERGCPQDAWTPMCLKAWYQPNK